MRSAAPDTQLASDLADLAQWAGVGRHVPELRVDGPVKAWAEYGTAGKVHLLQVRAWARVHGWEGRVEFGVRCMFQVVVSKMWKI